VKPDRRRVDELVEQVLAGRGQVPFAALLALVVPVSSLRDVARGSGLNLRGYRIDSAPADALARLLAESTDPRVLGEVCTRFLARLERARPNPAQPATADLEPMLRLKTQEAELAASQAARADEAAARLRAREAELLQRLERDSELVARQRAEIEQLRRALEQSGRIAVPGPDPRRVRELERELEVLAEAEQGLRRRMAELTATNRALREEVDDLAAKIPKGKRKKAPTPAPSEPTLFRLPYLTPGFYKSLEGKDRRSAERAVAAVLLLCTEGPGYPGLEVKQIEGQALWSMRASLKLRVYFAYRSDGDVEVLALADREDQHTVLRRLRER
jgi:hypothetical protein